MHFQTFQMIIDGNIPDNIQIQKLFNLTDDTFEYNNYIYTIQPKKINNNILWIYCQFENKNKYGTTVYDDTTKKIINNTRDKSKVELREQLFIAYDINTKRLYISNINKKGFIKTYIKSRLGYDIIIKNIYSSLDDFQKAIKYLKTISFTEYHNIVNYQPDTIFNRQINVLGIDIPYKLKMQLDYSRRPISTLKKTINMLKSNRNNAYFENVILIGEDDKGIEQIFDFNNIIEKINIDVKKDENEQYNSKEVQNLFIKNIEGKYV
ncbi:hypothetical protein [uncultured Anaerofustis sp.]|uniref:hypothetical protein n=1 Tax=uncultured Anaerofustis sp. TaxID=904996 RepID=UPI0025DB55B0|nr:hypothetical protein [uncultured Anaerofustis sp.]